MRTVVVHRTPVTLPAHAFTARHQDRHTLAGLRLVRMAIPDAIVARRARQALVVATPAVVSHVAEFEAIEYRPAQWPWTLASLAFIVLLVAACLHTAL